MTDIVERLREAGDCQDGNWAIYDDAADEIESLRSQLADYQRDFVASCSLHAHAGLEARLAEAQNELEADAKDIENLRSLNDKLQQDYVDLICQFGEFSTQATENTIRAERVRQVLAQHLTVTDPEQLQLCIRVALGHLEE
jgi:hypothetical protein